VLYTHYKNNLPYPKIIDSVAVRKQVRRHLDCIMKGPSYALGANSTTPVHQSPRYDATGAQNWFEKGMVSLHDRDSNIGWHTFRGVSDAIAGQEAETKPPRDSTNAARTRPPLR